MYIDYNKTYVFIKIQALVSLHLYLIKAKNGNYA